jgi:hypothetical protein
MRIDRDRLIFLALLVLDEACDEAKKGPVQPSFSIRLALACLYTLGDGDQTLFESFWREMRTESYWDSSPNQAAYLRATYTTTHFTGIARSVGVELSIDYSQRLFKARRGKKPAVPKPP